MAQYSGDKYGTTKYGSAGMEMGPGTEELSEGAVGSAVAVEIANEILAAAWESAQVLQGDVLVPTSDTLESLASLKVGMTFPLSDSAVNDQTLSADIITVIAETMSALTALASGLKLNAVLADSVVTAEILAVVYSAIAAETYQGGDSVVIGQTTALADSGTLTAALDAKISISQALANVVQAQAVADPQLSFTEALSAGGTLSAVLTAIGHGVKVFDTVMSTQALSAKIAVMGTVATGLAAQDIIIAKAVAVLDDNLAASDVVADLITLYAAILEAATIADSLVDSISLFVVENAVGAVSDTVTANITLTEILSQGGEAFATVNLGGDLYSAYVVNSETQAFSRYQNYPFNSFADFGDKFLAAADDGIYEMTGDTDDGETIKANLLTGLLDMGTSLQKRIDSANFGIATDGQMVLQINVIEGGKKNQYWYLLDPSNRDNIRDGVISLGHGLQSRYSQYNLVNKAGADFQLDTMEFYPVILGERKSN